jgi:hypothetical protein
MIVVRDANGGAGAPPEELASLIDQSLVDAPRGEAIIGTLEMTGFKFAAREKLSDAGMPLDVEGGSPFEGLPLTYKFVSANGRVVVQDRQLIYLPRPTKQPQVLTVFAINRNGSAFRKDLELPSV